MWQKHCNDLVFGGFGQIIFGGQDNSEKGPSLFDQAAGIFSSLNRFMRVISR